MLLPLVKTGGRRGQMHIRKHLPIMGPNLQYYSRNYIVIYLSFNKIQSPLHVPVLRYQLLPLDLLSEGP